MKALGTVLILLALVAFMHQGFTYTKREKVIDIGSFEATTERRERVYVPPLASGIALATGLILVLASRQTAPR